MHVVTFYSFKGGSGRSMALVNVAVEMVKAGLRVLIVDFDLEAPGLDTFNLPRRPKTTNGVVDFVLQYLETHESADVSQFIYKSAVPDAKGELWLMPSGGANEEYGRRFRSVNWQDLYENHKGYVLFEDMKAQWKQFFRPDYVLIDSRTGHTDVSGICTRQLPDAVVVFFFPNEQNRRGLESVVRQIRRESEAPRKKDIKIHFVMSNVPELDDEEGFLANSVARLKETLKFDDLSAVIHHYPSLALLTQSIFTLDRPKTRLAQEYAALARIVRRDNLEDREVALEFLDQIAPHARARRMRAGDLEQRVEEILKKHGGDSEILTRVAVLFRRQRRFDEALALLEQAGRGTDSAEFHLTRAELYAIKGDLTAAVGDVKELLGSDDATYFEVGAAVRLLQQRSPESLNEIVQAPAFRKLEITERYYIAHELLDSRKGLKIAALILGSLVRESPLDPQLEVVASCDLSLALIGLGRFGDAIKVITREGRVALEEFSISDCFNYAVAVWGATSSPSPELFRRVVDLDQEKRTESANGHQCLALALWATDEVDRAAERLDEAKRQMNERAAPEFSCWSYLQVPPDIFLEDLVEIRELLHGKSIEPRFIRDNRTLERRILNE